MLRAQQAAKRALAGRISSQESRLLGGRIGRWRSDQIAAIDLESVLTSDQSIANYSTAVPPPLSSPRSFRSVRPLSSQQRVQSEEDVRYLFDTLRSFATNMPQKLARVNGEARPRADFAIAKSWRDASGFQSYRNSRPVVGTWGRSNLAATSEAVQLDVGEEEETPVEEEETEDTIEPEQQTLPDDNMTEPKEQAAPKKFLMIAPDADVYDVARASSNMDVLNKMEAQIMAALQRNNINLAIELFEAATVGENVELSLKVVQELFRRLTYEHPFHAYQLMQYIIQRTGTDVFVNEKNSGNPQRGLNDEGLCWMYNRMCFSLRVLDPQNDRHGNIRSLVGSVSAELKQLSEEVQKKCYPQLVVSLVLQKSTKMGKWANRAYNRMSRMGVELPSRYFLQLLAHSKYNRDDLPYHDVLLQVVKGGERPYPHIVLGAVENMYPYTGNVRGTYVALQCVMELQAQTQQILIDQEDEASQIKSRISEIEGDGGKTEELKELNIQLSFVRDPHSYVMDIVTLECMADAAAKKNFVDLILLVWDALDVMGLEASEALYETTILCFAENPQLLENCFAVLNDMEQKYTPSQPFVRAFGVAMRKNPDSLYKADTLMEAARSLKQGSIECSPSVLNGLMAAHSWKGNVERCMDLLDAFRDTGVSPDEVSFAYALESIGKAAKRLVDNKRLRMGPRKRESLVESYFEATENVLSRLEKARDKDGNAIVPSHHFVRQYVEFLCILGETTTAGLVVQDFLEQDSVLGQLVDNKTLWTVAASQAEKGNYELARQLAASMSEALLFTEAKIANIELYFNRTLENDVMADPESQNERIGNDDVMVAETVSQDEEAVAEGEDSQKDE